MSIYARTVFTKGRSILSLALCSASSGKLAQVRFFFVVKTSIVAMKFDFAA